MKIIALAILTCAVTSAAEAQVSPPTPGGEQFYGNLNVVGKSGCSAVPTNVYPATAGFENVPSGQTIGQQYYVKILLQAPATKTAVAVPLQYIEDVFNPGDSTFVAYDPALFGITTGVVGTYSSPTTNTPIAMTTTTTTGPGGQVFTIASLTFNNLVTTAPLPGGGTSAPPCILTFNGTLYFSPD
jgi:hypothetical protein